MLLVLLLSGCALKPQIVVVDTTPRPASAPELLLDEPTGAYRTIALVRVPPSETISDVNKLKARVVLEAAKLGAHAVIIGFEKDDTEIFIPAGAAWLSVP